MKEIDIQVQEAQTVPNKLDPKRNTPRHIIIKMPKVKDKERILEAAWEKQKVTYKGVPIRLSADVSKETLQARRAWQEVFKMMKSKDLQPRLLYPAKLSFRMEGQIKCFPAEVKLKELLTKPPSSHSPWDPQCPNGSNSFRLWLVFAQLTTAGFFFQGCPYL